MKAVVMAGGRGTRARPYTDYFPKAMMPVQGRPLVSHVVDYLLSLGQVGEVVVLTDLRGMGAQVGGYLGGRRGVTLVQDAQSGTGGDLLRARPHLRGEETFVLWFVDNLCRADVAGMESLLRRTGSLACVATRSTRREETGFAEVGPSGIVKRFVEKPTVPMPMAECLGIYALSTAILPRISRKAAEKRRAAGGKGGGGGGGGASPPEVNLSYDVLEALAADGRVCAYDIGGEPWLDAESPAAVDRNAATAAEIVARMAGRSGRTRTRRSPRRTARA